MRVDQIFMSEGRCLQAFQWCGLHSQDHLHEMEHKFEHENWSSNFLIKGNSQMGKVQELSHGGNVSICHLGHSCQSNCKNKMSMWI
jgi:hypothetical protein